MMDPFIISSRYCCLISNPIVLFFADLEWKVLYVGSAHDSGKDQVLDEILVGPVPVGMNKFVLQADAPLPQHLPPDDILGVTVVLVTCSYKEREFVRVGYYVNNELLGHDPETPAPVYPQLDLKQVQRAILADKPRVTKFPIQWDDTTTMVDSSTQQQQQQSNDENTSQHHTNLPALAGQQQLSEVEAKMAAAMDRGGAAASTTAVSADAMETD